MHLCCARRVACWQTVSLRKFIRWLLWLLAGAALGLLCLALTSRWWLPPVLPQLAGWWGVELAAVERVEDGRLRLSGLVVELEAASVAIDQVELPGEWRYLRERFGGAWSEAATLRIGQVRIVPGATPAPTETESGEAFLPQIRRQILQGLAAADPWLPRVELARIEYRDGARVVAWVEGLGYANRKLSGRAFVDTLPGPWAFAAELTAEAPWQLEFSQVDGELSGSIELAGDDGQARVDARLERGDSQARLTASFGASAWLPAAAHASSEGFDLAGMLVPLNADFTLAPLRLEAFQAKWDGGTYRLSGAGQSLVQAADMADQSVAFELSAQGDMQTLRLEAVQLVSPWARLELSEPLAVDIQRRRFLGSARLRAEVDLAEQAWMEAGGRIEAELRAEADAPETLHFDLRGQQLSYADYAAERIEAAGKLDLETLQLAALTVIPANAAAGEQLELSGTADFNAATLDLEYSAWLGADWVNRMLGQQLLVAPLELEAGQITGPWAAPDVRGAVRTHVQTEAIEPLELSARWHWDGKSRLDWDALARCDGAEIEAVASVRIEQEAWSLSVDSLRWSDPDRPELTLAAPSHLSWRRTGDSFEARLAVSDFVLSGEDMLASVAYAPATGLRLRLSNVSLARLDRWMRAELPDYHIELIACELTAFRPYLAGQVRIAAEERFAAGALARLELSTELNERGVKIRDLALQFSGEQVLQGTIELPLRLRLPLPAADAADTEKSLYTLGQGALRGQLTGRASPAFTAWLQARTGLRLVETTLDMDIAGDLSNPAGHIRLQAGEVEIGPGLVEASLPTIQGLDVRVQVNESVIDVQTLNFSVNQSAVEAAFKLPVDALAAQLNAAGFDPLPILRTATGGIRLQDWKMEDWLDWLPPYFRRTGQLTGSLSLAPDLALSGQLRFEDFGLRPTASLALIDQLAGQLRLENRRLRIEQASARFGGSRVEFDGELDMSDWAQPRWFFDVQGEKLPLLRTTEMILRSDVAIRIEARDPTLSPQVAGKLKLRSSTLLVDLDPLAPRLNKGTTLRPPFFNIEDAPLASWRFNLQILGDQFMRVRSPYFRTRLSADFNLTGTFADPLLLGSVRTHDAELHFPGAKFVITEGEALIEASRPNEMQLAFSGIARKGPQVIGIEVSQTLEDPVIQFESTPPMPQADIVRLLATGSATGGGIGNLGLYLGQGMLGAGGVNDRLTDKLTLDVGEATSRSGRKTLGARYEFTPHWSAEGGYDVFDAYNADLIWTIFQR